MKLPKDPTMHTPFLWYAKAHGKSASEMLAHDEVRFPGGKMTGFQLWISAAKRIFRAEQPHCFLGRGWSGAPSDEIGDYGAWGRFLERAHKRIPRETQYS